MVLHPRARFLLKNNIQTAHSMTREETWSSTMAELQEFVKNNGRFPSKHREEEHKLMNRLKYIRKRYNQGLLTPQQKAQLENLIAMRHMDENDL